MTDLISRADAIEAVAEEWLSEASAESPYVNDDDIGAYRTLAENLFKDVPSAELTIQTPQTYGKSINPSNAEVLEDFISRADGEDLIIKGAKGIQDGLYNIKDGKLFKYKAKGGTVRTYPIVPSAEAVSRHDDGKIEVVRCKDCRHAGECHKSVQYTRNGQNTVTIGYSPIEWCSRGERREDGEA